MKPSEELKKKTVLYVEDEEVTVEFFSAMLSRYFGEIRVAKNGKEALDIYEEFAPDIVITDIEMPVLNGIELTKIIKKRHPNQPVIIITAFEDEVHLVEEADASLVKPIKRDDIIEVINRFV